MPNLALINFIDMKTLILCLLFLAGAGHLNTTKHDANKNASPVSILKVDVSASMVDWHITKITGKHDGTLKVYTGQLSVQNHRLKAGIVLLDMNTIAVTDLMVPDKQKLEANLKGDNFFDTGRFTVARFDFTSVEYSGKDSSLVTVAGILNLHGITKNVRFKAKIFKADKEALIARSDLAINRRDWNIATGNFKYDRLISPTITLHIVLRAS